MSCGIWTKWCFPGKTRSQNKTHVRGRREHSGGPALSLRYPCRVGSAGSARPPSSFPLCGIRAQGRTRAARDRRDTGMYQPVLIDGMKFRQI